MMRQLLIRLACTAMLLSSAMCRAQIGIGLYGPCSPVVRDAELIFDGPVNKMALQDNHLYIGGSFNTVGWFTGHFVQVNKKTGSAVMTGPWPWPRTNGVTNAIAASGKSIIIFGSFTRAGDSVRNYIACIDSNWLVTDFRPVVNGAVNAAVIYKDTLYIGGYFTTVNGQPRNRLAAIDLTTWKLTNWNPNVQNTIAGTLPCRIECLLQYNGMIYAGGVFNKVGAASRKNIAAIDAVTGIAGAWAPDAYFATAPDYGTVYKMLRYGNGLYMSGQFDVVGGQSHPEIALVNINTGLAHTWKPDPSSAVKSIAAKGDTLYICGYFTQVSGQPRPFLASYNMNSANIDLLPLTINTSNLLGDYIADISPSGDTLFIGGQFDTVNGQSRKNMAAVHTTTGALIPWKSHTDGSLQYINQIGGNLYIGGAFISAGKKERTNVAELDVYGDSITPWHPIVNGEVKAISPGKNVVYIGGDFTKVNGTARTFNAAIDKQTANVTSWNPAVSSMLNTVQEYKNDIYLGGSFSSIAGQTRYGLAKTDTANNVLPWIGMTKPGSIVYSMLTDKNRLFIGGQFTELTGIPKQNLGAIDASTGIIIPDTLKNAMPVRLLKKDDSNLLVLDGVSTLKTISWKSYKIRSYSGSSIYDAAILYNADTDKFSAWPWEMPYYGGRAYFSGGVNTSIFSVSTVNTMEIYGNKLYIGGSGLKDFTLGVSNAMMYSLPYAQSKASVYTDTTIMCKGSTSLIRCKSYNTYNAIYQWNVNGVDINNPLPYYFSTPADKDSVYCVVTTPPSGCRGGDQRTTNGIQYTVIPVVTPTISIAGPAEADTGSQVTVKAIVLNAADHYSIEWFNKGVSMGKSTVDSITYTKGMGTDSIYAIVTPRTDTCYVTDTSGLIAINEKPPVAISDVNGDAGITVYPNPFDKIIRILGLEEGDALLLYDITGRKILAEEYHGTTKEYTIVLGFLKAGTYVLKITDRHGASRKNVLIQKQ